MANVNYRLNKRWHKVISQSDLLNLKDYCINPSSLLETRDNKILSYSSRLKDALEDMDIQGTLRDLHD